MYLVICLTSSGCICSVESHEDKQNGMRRCVQTFNCLCIIKRKKKITSNDADAKVEKNDGVPEGSGCDGQSAHESARNDHRAAAVAVHQHAADGPCTQESERRQEGQSGERVIRRTLGAAVSLRLFDSAHLRPLWLQGQQVRRRRSPALAAQVTHCA